MSAESTDKIVELQVENKSLLEKETSLKSDLDESRQLVAERDESIKSLKEEIESLKAERDELKVKVDQFETEQALVQRKSDVLKALKEAGLDVDDKAQVSETFMDALMACEGEDKRAALIKDRAMVVESITKGEGASAVVTRERSKSDGGSAEYDPAKDFEDVFV